MKRGVLLITAAIALASCGGQVPVSDPGHVAVSSTYQPPVDPENTTTAPAIPTRPIWEGFAATAPRPEALVAMSRGETSVYEAPDDAAPKRTLPWTTILGTVSVYAVVDDSVDGWVEVMLPERPNGSTGWMKRPDVELYVVSGRIVVDLSDRQLVYYADGKAIFTTTVAVGSSRNPTPTGEFYVTDSVTINSEGGPWGPYALGLSARSDTITEFNGGDGIIGIHGTNRPSSIGEAASLGCVRLPNDMITVLHGLAPIGTPVEIRA